MESLLWFSTPGFLSEEDGAAVCRDPKFCLLTRRPVLLMAGSGWRGLSLCPDQTWSLGCVLRAILSVFVSDLEEGTKGIIKGPPVPAWSAWPYSTELTRQEHSCHGCVDEAVRKHIFLWG